MLKELTKDYLPEGLPLISITPRSNAAIMEVVGDSILILSDFGNTLKLGFDQLSSEYKVHEEYLMGYPIEPLEERISHQIELLTKAKELLEEGL